MLVVVPFPVRSVAQALHTFGGYGLTIEYDVHLFNLRSRAWLLVMGDSAALTAGTVAAASPNRRGTTLALHATLGFGAGLVAPAVFGLVLDLSGGGTRVAAWGWAYASQGVFCLIVPLAWAWLHRHR